MTEKIYPATEYFKMMKKLEKDGRAGFNLAFFLGVVSILAGITTNDFRYIFPTTIAFFLATILNIQMRFAQLMYKLGGKYSKNKRIKF